LSGVVRESGGGAPLARVQIIEEVAFGTPPNATYTDQNGLYRLTVHPSGSPAWVALTFAKDGYDSSQRVVEPTANSNTQDFTLQPMIHISAGGTLTGTLFPDDPSYHLIEEDFCYPCKLIHVMVPPGPGGLLDLSLSTPQSLPSPQLLVLNGYSYSQGTTLELPRGAGVETSVMVTYPPGLNSRALTPQPFELITSFQAQ
jgi:hypothetical protein